MKKRWLQNSSFFFLAMAFAIMPSSLMARDFGSASLSLIGKRVVGKPGTHHRPLAQAIYVSESEGCSAHSAGSNTIEVSDQCQYLSGLYRYIYLPQGESQRRQVLVGFSLERKSPQSHVFLAEAPIEIEETTISPESR